MWRIRIAAALAVISLLQEHASATVYTFHDTESSALSPAPVSFTFSLDTATAGTGANGTLFNNITINKNGTLFAGNSVEASFTTNLGSPLFFLIDTSLRPFYLGSGTGIIFNTGTFAIADGATDGEGTLVISAAMPLPTPEPATWTLLLAGFAMTAAAFRFSPTSCKRNENTI